MGRAGHRHWPPQLVGEPLVGCWLHPQSPASSAQPAPETSLGSGHGQRVSDRTNVWAGPTCRVQTPSKAAGTYCV